MTKAGKAAAAKKEAQTKKVLKVVGEEAEKNGMTKTGENRWELKKK